MELYIQDGDLHFQFAVQILHQVVEQTLKKNVVRKSDSDCELPAGTKRIA